MGCFKAIDLFIKQEESKSPPLSLMIKETFPTVRDLASQWWFQTEPWLVSTSSAEMDVSSQGYCHLIYRIGRDIKIQTSQPESTWKYLVSGQAVKWLFIFSRRCCRFILVFFFLKMINSKIFRSCPKNWESLSFVRYLSVSPWSFLMCAVY